MALRRPHESKPDPSLERLPGRNLRRWLIPIIGGLLAGVLIVIGTPHVAWFVRLILAVIAFAYVCGQSAAYLWTSDQG